MTARRPIVRVGGRDQQLPVGDTLDLPLATTTEPGLMQAQDKAKLNGVQNGATANSPDATLLNRANHTGTQTLATISDAGSAARLEANSFAQSFLSAASAAAQREALDIKQGVVIQPTNGDFNTGAYIVTGEYTLPALVDTGFSNRPADAAGLSRAYLKVYSTGGYITQELSLNNNRMFSRSFNGSIWTAWSEGWNTSNLEKITSALDFASSRVLTVGFAGWGGRTPTKPGNLADQESSLFYDATLEIFPVAGPMINVRGNRSFAYSARASRCWTYTYGENPVLMEHWTDKNFNPANYSTTVQMQAAIVAATTGTPIITEAAGANTLTPARFANGAPYMRFTSTSAFVLTVPTNSQQAIPVGAEITLRRAANANLTISPAPGVIVNPPAGGTLVMTQNMTATLKKVATNEWDLIGQTVAA